jgi:hypothetical protein
LLSLRIHSATDLVSLLHIYKLCYLSGSTLTDRATAACRRSNCQLLRIEGATWSAWRVPMAKFSVL